MEDSDGVRRAFEDISGERAAPLICRRHGDGTADVKPKFSSLIDTKPPHVLPSPTRAPLELEMVSTTTVVNKVDSRSIYCSLGEDSEVLSQPPIVARVPIDGPKVFKVEIRSTVDEELEFVV